MALQLTMHLEVLKSYHVTALKNNFDFSVFVIKLVLT
jgi:hypothetical protein